MTQEQFQAFQDLKRQRIAEELTHAPRWHYLSFANNEAFLGAAIVRAHGIVTAVERARKLAIYPGGEVMGAPIKSKELSRVPKELRNRLLTETEVRSKLEVKTSRRIQLVTTPGLAFQIVSARKPSPH
jgi:hypothetical protein